MAMKELVQLISGIEVWPLCPTMLCLQSFWSSLLDQYYCLKAVTEKSLSPALVQLLNSTVALSEHKWLLCFYNWCDNTQCCLWKRSTVISLMLQPHLLLSLLTLTLFVVQNFRWMFIDFNDCKYMQTDKTPHFTIFELFFCLVVVRGTCKLFSLESPSMWFKYFSKNISVSSASCFWRYYAKLECTPISQKWLRLRAAQREPLVGFRATNLSQCHLVPSAQYHLCLKLSVWLCQQQVRFDPLCATQIWPYYISTTVTTGHFCF